MPVRTGEVVKSEYCLFIAAQTIKASSDRNNLVVSDPSTGRAIGQLPCATPSDLKLAADAAENAFNIWKQTSPAARSNALRRISDLVRQRTDVLAHALTCDQGKPLKESRAEVTGVA